MKTLLFYSIYVVLIFNLISCTDSNGDNTTTKSKDSAATFKKVANTALVSPIRYWKIDKDTADKMKAYATTCTENDCKNKEPQNIDWNLSVYQDILNSVEYPQNVKFIPARYREEDQQRYTDKRHITDVGKGKVKYYLTYIVEVSYPEKTGSNPDYYDIVTICPPPTGTCNSILNVNTDSTKAGKK